MSGNSASSLDEVQLLELLNELLEGERAGARGLRKISKRFDEENARDELRLIGKDEARFCAMLAQHIEHLGGTPSPTTGAFYDRLMAEESAREQLLLLNRGQAWVVRKIQAALPNISERALHADLTEMLEVHEANIARCEQLTI